MTDRHQQPTAEQKQLDKKKKKVTPVCPYRLEPGQLLFYGNETKPEKFEVVDELDKRNFYRQAADMHREVRKYARTLIKPGASLLQVAIDVEAKIAEVCGNKNLATCMLGQKSTNQQYYCGQAFPLGLSVNECAAHYAPLPNDDHIVTENDIIKVDFGIHCNGYLVDSAFSMHWNPELDQIVQASREATDEAMKVAGPDVLLSELGNRVEEIICSYEYKGKNLNPVRNLCGHMVDRYCIHSGKSIPLHRDSKSKDRMEVGEVYACETFASTGRGKITDFQPTSHYMVAPEAVSLGKAMIQGTDQTRALFDVLKKNFHTLAWNPRWLPSLGVERYQLQLDSLVKNGYVNDYPKLIDKAGCYVSQFEHTFMIGEWGKEVFTRGDDY
ncbi:Methionine_aminopeptidase [Hexamita inflata]|uniref:Methionine aminopeptidase n=1 Tax=Hexamita inflata TaxID=28002 RepID=A0AA86VGN8_9EUKA|nr:Methionine aminopeptidase [Hexamita inflata]